MKKIVKIDENGFLLYGEDLMIDNNEVVPEGYIDTPIPSNEEGQLPFYKLKWTGKEWVEGLTEEEINQLKKQLKPPSEKERLEALEKAMLEIALGGM